MESIPINIYEVGDGFHMNIDVMINNQKASLIIDTGASVSVFDEQSIRNLVSRTIRNKGAEAAGAGGNCIEQKEVLIQNMQIGFLSIQDYSAAVMDLSHINKSYKELGIKNIDGILGGDILKFYDAVIDYSKKELMLRNY